MTKELRNLRKKLLSIKKAAEKSETTIKLSKEEIEELFKEYSKETREDINNNCNNGYLNWSKLKTETLKEIAYGPVLVVGEGEDTVVIIDDIPED